MTRIPRRVRSGVVAIFAELRVHHEIAFDVHLELDGEGGGYPDPKRDPKPPADFVDRWYNATGMANLRTTLGRQWGTMPRYLNNWGVDATHAVLGVPHVRDRMQALVLDYVGAFRADVAFDWAVQAIRTRRVDVRPLISAQLPLSRSREAFE